MFACDNVYPTAAAELYPLIKSQMEALVAGVPYSVANLANASALLWQAMEDINWAGFYLTEGSMLVLGPFQGNPACVEIQYGKGVCGTAAATDRAQLVPDVHAFKGHIACGSASRSEIVIPIHQNGAVVGVLDIDSPSLERFKEEDLAGLQELVIMLEKTVFN